MHGSENVIKSLDPARPGLDLVGLHCVKGEHVVGKVAGEEEAAAVWHHIADEMAEHFDAEECDTLRIV